MLKKYEWGEDKFQDNRSILASIDEKWSKLGDYFNKSDCVTAYIMVMVFNNFENEHFSIMGIEAEGTKLVFSLKVFRQQNINPLQVFL